MLQSHSRPGDGGEEKKKKGSYQLWHKLRRLINDSLVLSTLSDLSYDTKSRISHTERNGARRGKRATMTVRSTATTDKRQPDRTRGAKGQRSAAREKGKWLERHPDPETAAAKGSARKGCGTAKANRLQRPPAADVNGAESRSSVGDGLGYPRRTLAPRVLYSRLEWSGMHCGGEGNSSNNNNNNGAKDDGRKSYPLRRG